MRGWLPVIRYSVTSIYSFFNACPILRGSRVEINIQASQVRLVKPSAEPGAPRNPRTRALQSRNYLVDQPPRHSRLPPPFSRPGCVSEISLTSASSSKITFVLASYSVPAFSRTHCQPPSASLTAPSKPERCPITPVQQYKLRVTTTGHLGSSFAQAFAGVVSSSELFDMSGQESMHRE